jgi:hypothetical protein
MADPCGGVSAELIQPLAERIGDELLKGNSGGGGTSCNQAIGDGVEENGINGAGCAAHVSLGGSGSPPEDLANVDGRRIIILELFDKA